MEIEIMLTTSIGSEAGPSVSLILVYCWMMTVIMNHDRSCPFVPIYCNVSLLVVLPCPPLQCLLYPVYHSEILVLVHLYG